MNFSFDKIISAFFRFLETVKDVYLLLFDILPCVVCC